MQPAAQRRQQLVLMAREPSPGQVKTRLIPALGPDRAAELYAAFVRDKISDVQAFRGEIAVTLAHTPATAPLLSGLCRGLDPAIQMTVQEGSSLPERMARLAAEMEPTPQAPLAIMGTDSPLLSMETVRDAYASLATTTDIVLIPDHGGGYCLIGMCTALPLAVFRGADGSRSSLERTRRAAMDAGFTVECLAPQHDVDTGADLEALIATIMDGPQQAELIAPRTCALLVSWSLLNEAARDATAHSP